MKSFLPKLLLVLALAAGAVVVALYLAGGWQDKKIETLEQAIAGLQEEAVPLRFMVLSRNLGGLTVRFRLYNLAGEELGMMETSLPGQQLFFDFLAVPRQEAWLAFPYRVFTETMAPGSGLALDSIVAPAGVPLTYAGGAFSQDELAELGRVYRALLADTPVQGAFGNAVHDIAELSAFEPGQVYRVLVRKKGGIEILADL